MDISLSSSALSHFDYGRPEFGCADYLDQFLIFNSLHYKSAGQSFE